MRCDLIGMRGRQLASTNPKLEALDNDPFHLVYYPFPCLICHRCCSRELNELSAQ